MDLANYEPTVAEVAGLFGKSSRWIAELRAKGVMPADGATLREFVDAWIEYQTGSGEAGDLEAERTRLTKEQADAQELRNAQLRRELLPADQVANAMQAVLTNFRRRALGLPNNLAQRLAATSDRQAVDDILSDAMGSMLTALSETDFDVLLNGADRSAEDDGNGIATAAEAEPE